MTSPSLQQQVASHIAGGMGGAALTGNAGRDINAAVERGDVTSLSTLGAAASAASAVLSFTPFGKTSDAAGVLSGVLSIYSDIDEGKVVTDRALINTLSSIAGLAAVAGVGSAAAVLLTAAGIGLGLYGLIVSGDSQEVNDAVAGLFDALGGMSRSLESAMLPSEFGGAVASAGKIPMSDFMKGFTDTGFSCLPLLAQSFGSAESTYSPLILDLDGDGVETLSKSFGVHFDHDGNNFAEATGWVGKDDGLLVWDRNGNGVIDDGGELFGNFTKLSNGLYAENGFAALADLDSNFDGKIDSNDEFFNQLRVWKDSNSDAKSDGGELLTLAEVGVKDLGLAFENVNIVDAGGNTTLQSGFYVDSSGRERGLNDVWFSVDQGLGVNLGSLVAVDSGIVNIRGFGVVEDLNQSIAKDPAGFLASLIANFSLENDQSKRQIILDSIIFTWTGSDTYSSSSRGGYIDDGRKLFALEAFVGRSFSQNTGTGEGGKNPGPNAAAKLMKAYDLLSDSIYAGLMLQTHFKPFESPRVF